MRIPTNPLKRPRARGLLKDRFKTDFHNVCTSRNTLLSSYKVPWLPVLYSGDAGFHHPAVWNLELLQLPGSTCNSSSLPGKNKEKFPIELVSFKTLSSILIPKLACSSISISCLSLWKQGSNITRKACNTLKTCYERTWVKGLMHWSNLNMFGWPEVGSLWENKGKPTIILPQ